IQSNLSIENRRFNGDFENFLRWFLYGQVAKSGEFFEVVFVWASGKVGRWFLYGQVAKSGYRAFCL
ncbi:MAG: hypothetical protein IJ071_04695, partial [Ruminococcus sp.]|nr:hypothetical protein [Ruminococcus sp.]